MPNGASPIAKQTAEEERPETGVRPAGGAGNRGANHEWDGDSL